MSNLHRAEATRPGTGILLAVSLASGLFGFAAPVAGGAEEKGGNAPAREIVERRLASMGTFLDVAVVAANRETGLAASERVVAEARRVEDLLTTWRDSPLSRLNSAAPGEDVAVGPELAAVLAEMLRWSARTDDAFDPTVAPLMRAWDLRGAGRVPDRSELAAAVAATGPGRFRVSSELGTAARLHPAAGIDEGAWGKGYALDRIAERLADAGVRDALIDLGGQTLALGRDPSGASGNAWRIGIAHPRERQRPVATLSLSNLSASTSANSERGRSVGGRRIGHELDPHTGEPAFDFGSATVLAPSALVADVLSTAFFVLGPEKGLALSESLRREGVAQEVLFLIDRDARSHAQDSRRLEALASPGFAQHVVSADPEVAGVLTPAVTSPPQPPTP
jgi:thiamine biosynthesis lipoprotein